MLCEHAVREDTDTHVKTGIAFTYAHTHRQIDIHIHTHTYTHTRQTHTTYNATVTVGRFVGTEYRLALEQCSVSVFGMSFREGSSSSSHAVWVAVQPAGSVIVVELVTKSEFVTLGRACRRASDRVVEREDFFGTKGEIKEEKEVEVGEGGEEEEGESKV